MLCIVSLLNPDLTQSSWDENDNSHETFTFGFYTVNILPFSKMPHVPWTLKYHWGIICSQQQVYAFLSAVIAAL